MSTFNEKTDATIAFNGIDGGTHAGATPDDMQGHGAPAMPLAGSDEPLSSHHDGHGADTAPLHGPQSDTGTHLAGLPAVGSAITALRSIDGDSDLGLVVGHSDGGLKRLLSSSPTTTLMVAPQSAAANPTDSFSASFSSAAHFGAGSTGTAAGGLDGAASYRLSATAATAPAFVGLTGTSNPFSGVNVQFSSAPSLGDIDGDGDLDLVVRDFTGAMRYFRNTGTATAPAYAEQTGAASPFNGIPVGDLLNPSLADIDSDGDLDLVIGAFDGTLRYFRNTGTATAPAFAEQTGTASPFNGIDAGDYISPSLGDIDGDGDLDLVVGDDAGTLRYYRNTGTATAPAYAEQSAAANPFDDFNVGFYSTPSLGDIDGDGDLDLVVGDDAGTLSYYRNTGTAVAPAYAEQTLAFNPFDGVDAGGFSNPSLGDFDGDGDLDLVVGNDAGTLLTFQNQAAPTPPVFAALTGASNPFNGFDVGSRSAPSLGDIDGDGDLDLVVGERDGVLNYYRNTGTATAPVYSAQAGANNPFNGFGVGFDSAPSLGDIDADGDLDLVVGDAFGTLNYYRNTGTATAPVYSAQTGTNNPFNGFDVGVASTPSLGDIDGDGDLDLVVGNFDGVLDYYRNTGTAIAPVYVGQVGTDNPFNGFNVGFNSTPSLGDIDGDGDLDLVVGENDGTLRYYLNTGTATAPAYAEQTGTANPFGSFDVGRSSTSSLSDIDGDGDLDLTVGAGVGTLLTFINNDAPTLRQAAINLTGTNEDTTSPGDTVAALLAAAGWADVDVGALKGLAVTATTGLGQWQYSVGGAVWTPFGAVSATAALLLADGTSVRYAPDAQNSETATLTFRAWDQTSGTASTDGTARTADTSSNGGGTAFSSASSTASQPVTAVNDAPTLNVSAFNLPGTDEDTTTTFTVGSLLAAAGWVDVDAGALQGLVITATSGLGQWQWTTDGTTWVELRSILGFQGINPVASTISAATSLRYVPNAIDGETATLSFRAWDQTQGIASSTTPSSTTFNGLPQANFGGTGSQSIASSTASLVVTPINDAPTTSPVTLGAIQEDSSTLLITQSMLLVNANDVDGLAPMAVNLQKTTGLGQLVDNLNGTWSYTPAANDDTSVSFSYSVSDGKLSAAGAATLDIKPVNDNPVAVADTALTKLNTAVSIAVLANDSDIDGGALRVVATTQGNGGTAAVQPGNLTVLYTPSTGFSGFDSFGYTVSDGAGGTASANVRVLVASALGTNGNDALLGTQLVDYIVGQDGDDSIQARGGADYVDGGRGADTISGGDGADTLLGGDGPDTFVATGPELVGDQIDGGDGTDTLVVTSSMAVLPANFSFTNLEQVSHNGLVVLHPGLVDLSALTLAPGSNNKIIGDVANNRIIGTKSDDNISDTAGNDDLRGADGSDTIQAGVGQDTIYGGNGNDRLCGDRFTSPNDGARDTLVFDTALNAATNVDQIVGFQASSQDLIMLAPSIFGAITGGATTGLDADEFRSVNGGNAQDGNDFILFDPLTGNLFYDADGSGGGTKVLFATLVSLAGTLDATDFVAAVP